MVATQRFFIFTPIPGEMIQFDYRIFFKGVGSTTNEVQIFRHLGNTAAYQVETLQRGDSFPRPMSGWPEEFVPGEQVGYLYEN